MYDAYSVHALIPSLQFVYDAYTAPVAWLYLPYRAMASGDCKILFGVTDSLASMMLFSLKFLINTNFQNRKPKAGVHAVHHLFYYN